MTDVAIPLAHAGLSLSLGVEFTALSESSPAAYIDLIRHRYLATLFRPRWGLLFNGEHTHATTD